jgi:YD repeat-containing protein
VKQTSINNRAKYTNDYFKNSNVKSQEILGSYKENFDNTTDLNLTYTYDKSNRLLETENTNQEYKDNFKLENKFDKDGNILELKRYEGDGSMADNFNYAYYTNTNKLQRVTGSGTQYTYDANGNMITDDINRNKDIKYDYRNLIIQLRHKKIVLEDSLVYLTYYYYDESGNRIRKRVKFTGKERDEENLYDYFGARYYDSRIGRWGGVDP